jgi:hypothetical protein
MQNMAPQKHQRESAAAALPNIKLRRNIQSSGQRLNDLLDPSRSSQTKLQLGTQLFHVFTEREGSPVSRSKIFPGFFLSGAPCSLPSKVGTHPSISLILVYRAANKDDSAVPWRNALSFSHPFTIKSLPSVKPAIITSGGATLGPCRGRLLYQLIR